MIDFTLSFEGSDADQHQLDLYDLSQAMLGFQRSLALTTHLVINGEVITQAPSLKNACIYINPPEEGSFKVPTKIVLIPSVAFTLGTAQPGTPIGHLMHSAYDYVISETMGFHVDYERSLGQQYEELREQEDNQIPILEQSQLDSVIEKCERSIEDMHRPIVKSQTADNAKIYRNARGEDIPLQAPLTQDSFEYIKYTHQSNLPQRVLGKVSSYNINTFKGRVFIPDERRPISFTLSESARTVTNVNQIMRNMSMNARDRFTNSSDGGDLISLEVLQNTSRSGRLKSYYVLDVN